MTASAMAFVWQRQQLQIRTRKLLSTTIHIVLLNLTMPIGPITGKLRKRFWVDVSCALGLGVSAGYAYW